MIVRISAIAFFVVAGAVQNPTTTLVVQVAPEAHVNPPQTTLSFVVSPDGAGDITTKTVALSAWVRALRGQPIRLTATQIGSIPVTWKGTAIQSTAGGRQAACTSGSFAGSSTQDLSSNWQTSGTLQCQVSFSLSDPRRLLPGTYTTTLVFAAH
jgi:hypothetical protein